MIEKPVHEMQIDQLPVRVYSSNAVLGQAAAFEAAAILKQTVDFRGEANLILATGNSQLTFLEALRADPSIEWAKINLFHMDEYVGIDPSHPASFPFFLRSHLVDHVHPKAFYPIQADASQVDETIQAYEALLKK